MEEYLQYMKTLRSQMNDVEEQAAKISVEEQMHFTTVQTLQKDLELAKVEVERLKQDADNMMKAKGQICSQILEKQRKIASLESDSITVNQSLELIQQERGSLSARLVEKSMYYTKMTEELTAELKEQQGWINAHKDFLLNKEHSVPDLGLETVDPKPFGTKDSQDADLTSLMNKLDAAKAKLDHMTQRKINLESDCIEANKSIELVNCKINQFQPALREMDGKALEEEFQALLSDKEGEAEYLQSLQHQISRLKEISHLIKCSCGEEIKVELEACMFRHDGQINAE